MPTWTFIKQVGAPSGSIRVTVADGQYTIDDSSNPSISTTNAQVAGELAGMPYLLQAGGSPTGVPSIVNVEDAFLANGVLSKKGPNGTTIGFDGTEFPTSFRGMGTTASNLLLAGHSFLDPTGLVMKNTPAPEYSVGARIAARLGVQAGQVKNLAQIGAVIRSHLAGGTPKYLQAVDPGNTNIYPHIAKNAVTFAWFGANDLILGVGTGVQNGMIWNYRALISWMRASWAADYNHSSITTTGTWTPLLYSSVATPWGQGTGCTGTVTAGNHIDINLAPGGTHVASRVNSITVGLRFVTAPNGGTAQIAVDGVVKGTIDTFGANFNFNSQDERGSTVFRVPVTSANSTITITAQSFSGGGPLYFDGWHIESPKPPLFLIGEVTTPAIHQNLYNNQTPAFIDTANSWIDSIVAEFNDPSVRKVCLDRPLGKDIIRANGQGTSFGTTAQANLTFYGDDGLHPNELGAQEVAGEVYREVNRALLAGFDAGQLSTYAPFEIQPITSQQAVLYHGVGAPTQLLDNFSVPDSNSTPAGWTPLMGGWGIKNKQIALVSDMFPIDTFSDTFTRANGAVANGWTTISGTWAISSNEIKNTAVAGGGVRPLILSPQQLDASGNGSVSFTVGSVGEDFAGAVFRHQDAANYWMLQMDHTFTGWFLTKRVAGVETHVSSPTLIPYAAGSQLHIECSGSNIVVWDNNTLAVNVTDSALQTQRGTGLVAWSTFASGPTFDGFGVRSGPMDLTAAALPFNAAVRDLSTTDTTLSFVVGESAPYNLEGMLFRYQDPSNYMYLTESATFGGWVLTYVIAGVSASIGGSNYRLPATPNSIISIQMAGNNFTVSVNGQVTTAGTQTIAGAPTGTKAGPMLYPQTGTLGVTSVIPNMVLHSVSRGGNGIIVPDFGYYRDDVAGTIYGPFFNGTSTDQITWLPTSYGVDGAANVASLRTLGTGALQAAAGNAPSIIRQNGQSAVWTPTAYGSSFSSNGVTAQRLYMNRFVPSQTLPVLRIGFFLAGVDTANDPVMVAILDATGKVLAVSASTTGKVNATINTLQTVPLVFTCAAGTTYYAAFLGTAAAWGTIPTLATVSMGPANNFAAMFGTGYGAADMLKLDSQSTIPAVNTTLAAPTGPITGSVALALMLT